jgi:hypothetical protein
VQGAAGATQGAQGNPGPQGAQGANSVTAGPPGPQGSQGPAGIQGAQGLTGGQGFQGGGGLQPTGPQGAQGGQGFQGSNSAAGPQGAQGATGATGAQGAQGAPSDKRLKDNIKPISNPLEKTINLESVKFNWDYNHPKLKHDNSIVMPEAFQGEAIGFIAQDVEKVVSDIVWTDDQGFKSIQYGIMVGLGVGSIQEQQKRINSIYSRINKLNKIIGG